MILFSIIDISQEIWFHTFFYGNWSVRVVGEALQIARNHWWDCSKYSNSVLLKYSCIYTFAMGNWSVRVVWRSITNSDKLRMRLLKSTITCVVKVRLTDQILSHFSIIIDIQQQKYIIRFKCICSSSFIIWLLCDVFRTHAQPEIHYWIPHYCHYECYMYK